MKDRAHVVIVGGGVIGTGIAYNLAKLGIRDVVLVEQKRHSYGSTGRCGGGIRQQWSTEENIKLAKASVELFEGMHEELGVDIGLIQGGYLIPAFTEDEISTYKKNTALQNSLGVPTRWLSNDEIKELVPMLNTEKMMGATFCPTDGHANPFAVTEGYANKAKEMGVDIELFTKVTGIDVVDGAVKRVRTDKGDIETDFVVNAAGPYSPLIGEMAGIDMPNKPYRHEILATERFRHFLDTMIISFHHGLYFSQTARGEIVGGIGNPDEKPGYNLSSSLDFAVRMANAIIEFMPQFKNVNLVRQWAGFYDVTPDAKPILGEVDGVQGFIQANGYSGHGFMLAPIVTQLMAELIVNGKTSMPIDSMNMRRFKNRDMVQEANVVG